MGLFSSINPMSNVINLAKAIQSGDIRAVFQLASQIGLMFATGGSSAMLQGLIQQGIQQFGPQVMAQALGRELISMAGQEMIQQMGEQMGLPQFAIDAAQAAFCKECGDMQGYYQNHREAGNLGSGGFFDRLTVSRGEQRASQQFLQAILNGFQASPVEAGQVQNDFDNFLEDFANMIQEFVRKSKENEESEEGTGGVSGKGGWLRAMAEMMGDKLNEAWDEVSKMAENINKKDPKSSAAWQGAMQEFNALFQAFSASLKAAGEGLTSMARKQ